ncbi:uncharacterized protein BDCG_17517 [Blastomyces dermatitidis ER-3]|uniref:Uncharacterized protein n=2 Tax=Ajellomyces dermatitidis TaxID=5039 RepID=A0A0J9ENG3_AJEDA|nr:uncharacterized protein BDCG_17517 [Blastomyces dermatitidis ER-3]KMW67823.1 hypothetical protein BDDG_12353 [Blastomyces dermatitidis ATCC 18188]OAT02390.1 hypothetical protein BDCG_17517 [Blastomyces dermatitidis ER-3]
MKWRKRKFSSLQKKHIRIPKPTNHGRHPLLSAHRSPRWVGPRHPRAQGKRREEGRKRIFLPVPLGTISRVEIQYGFRLGEPVSLNFVPLHRRKQRSFGSAQRNRDHIACIHM